MMAGYSRVIGGIALRTRPNDPSDMVNDAGGATDTATDDTITVTINVTDSPTLTTPPQRPTPSTGGGVG